jgi:hypothetical protein
MVVLAAALLIAAVIVFGVSVRFGMLLGRRLDRALEERASASDPPGDESAGAADTGKPINPPNGPVHDGHET